MNREDKLVPMNPVVFDLLFSRQWFVQVLRGVCVCVCVCVCVAGFAAQLGVCVLLRCICVSGFRV